ncbi:hypothetical protein DJ010_03135 [Nocardioides silvaticus]|uniref:Lipoprotein LpqB beta-propeller domain-containing protein n=1 Tax=Nocardioides silvaticus TaxID=2201891 RepID=A0A316TLW2_9ACTN|nr:hypothetical protein [Nocardioides silvaticus]PWN04631.1 hypothetical protein DJ010_03135 [Nocardioides silvaticus]
MRPFARLAAAAAVSTLALTGCGSASEPSPPTGVDQLVVPTPTLDPADFVAAIDNPWLPLAVGNEWRYADPAGGRTVTVTVLDEPREIQGVTGTAVRTTTTDVGSAADEQTIDWYAQDDDGNVWLLGEGGSWEAGVDGAESGLAMPAEPRVGDGWRKEYAEGVAEDQVLVIDREGSASVPYDDLTDLLETEDTSALDPGVVERRLYARGIGLVRAQTVAGGDELLELVAFSED